jgi:hypothetical protein
VRRKEGGATSDLLADRTGGTEGVTGKSRHALLR